MQGLKRATRIKTKTLMMLDDGLFPFANHAMMGSHQQFRNIHSYIDNIGRTR